MNNSSCYDSSCKVFVGNVPFNLTEEEFKECFKSLDGYITAELISRNQTKTTRGFGFITFENNKYVKNFLDKRIEIILKDRKLRFTHYCDSNTDDFMINAIKKNNIFVYNIPEDYTDDKLKQTFSKFGKVILAYINKDINTKKKLTTGIVEFAEYETYEKIISIKNIKIEDNNFLFVSKFKENEKIKKTKNDYDIREIYKIAFNAGRKYGQIEQTIKN
jgi:RNA recognition motif-containing protein